MIQTPNANNQFGSQDQVSKVLHANERTKGSSDWKPQASPCNFFLSRVGMGAPAFLISVTRCLQSPNGLQAPGSSSATQLSPGKTGIVIIFSLCVHWSTLNIGILWPGTLYSSFIVRQILFYKYFDFFVL